MSIPAHSPREVRVAIIGSGLTGLVATYLLTASSPASSKPCKITVEIFERAATLGMDSASISVPLPLSTSITPPSSHPISVGVDELQQDGSSHLRSRKRLKLQTQADSTPVSKSASFLRIDVPMRAFTGGYYPQLLALYQHLGIRTKKTNFTYSFASLSTSLRASSFASASPTATASSSNTRSSSPVWHSEVPNKASIAALHSNETSRDATPSPSILYNGANGFRGVSIPSELQHPRLASPVKVSSVLNQVNRLRIYFSSLLSLVLGYLQLLLIALWHHYLGHTCDPTHPLRRHTLRDLICDPFPPRSPASEGRPHALRSRVGLLVEGLAESILRRSVCLDESFARQTLAPLFSAVMTSTLDSVWACPASEVLDYVALTLGKDHFVVKDGVRTVVASLLRHVDQAQTEVQASTSSSSSKVWTHAEVRSVRCRDGRSWVDVVHHGPSSPQKSAADEAETEDMSRQPSSSSTDRTFCSDQDQLDQHGPFDHVIFATQANQTAQFLTEYVGSLGPEVGAEQASKLRGMIDALTKFKYEKSVVVNHTDQTLLPTQKADWRDLNLISPSNAVERGEASRDGEPRRTVGSDWTDEEADEESDGSASNGTLSSSRGPLKTYAQSGYTMATHVLTLPPTGAQDILIMQTTNPHISLLPRPTSILSTSTFERAVIDVEAHVARQDLFSFSPPLDNEVAVTTAGGRRLTLGPLQRPARGQAANVWVCGSWAVGIPLLEGCVVSARLVAEQILRLEGDTLPQCARW